MAADLVQCTIGQASIVTLGLERMATGVEDQASAVGDMTIDDAVDLWLASFVRLPTLFSLKSGKRCVWPSAVSDANPSRGNDHDPET